MVLTPSFDCLVGISFRADILDDLGCLFVSNVDYFQYVVMIKVKRNGLTWQFLYWLDDISIIYIWEILHSL